MYMFVLVEMQDAKAFSPCHDSLPHLDLIQNFFSSVFVTGYIGFCWGCISLETAECFKSHPN